MTFEYTGRGRLGYIRVGVRNQLAANLNSTEFESFEKFQRFVSNLQSALGERTPKDVTSRSVPWIYFGGMAILVAVYVAFDISLRGEIDVVRVLEWGALNRTLLLEGDYFRLVTPAFIHISWLHLLLNLLLLGLTTGLMEPLIGRAQVALVLFASGLAASMSAGAFSTSTALLGASGAIYGMVGLLIHRWWVDRALVPVRLRSTPGWILAAVVLADFIASALDPRIAFSMHFGGLATGAIVSAILLRVGGLGARARVVAATAMSVVVLWCGGVLVVKNLAGDYGAEIAGTLLTSEHSDLDDVSNGAWWLAIQPNAEPAQLRSAESRLSSMLPADPSPGHLDTLATLAYRLGDIDRAVELERAVLRQSGDQFHASQLARFEWARSGQTGDETVTLVQQDAELCVHTARAEAYEVHAVQRHGDELQTFVTVVGVKDGECLARPAAVERSRAIIVTLFVRGVDGAVDEALEHAVAEAKAWRIDPTVLELP